MRLVDADALCDYLQNISHIDHRIFWDIAGVIQKQKIIDAVPVVRCRECRNKENCKYPATWNWCPDGERKEQEG